VFTPNSRRPSVAYTNGVGDLKYAVRTAANQWTITNIDNVPGGIAYIDMGYGGPYFHGAISYFDAQNADLCLAWYDHVTGWHTREMATAGATGLYSHINTPDVPENMWAFAYNRSTDSFSSFRTTWSLIAATTETIEQRAYGKYLSVGYLPDFDYLTLAVDSASGSLRVLERAFR
jgi:hypothetical protein